MEQKTLENTQSRQTVNTHSHRHYIWALFSPNLPASLLHTGHDCHDDPPDLMFVDERLQADQVGITERPSTRGEVTDNANGMFASCLATCAVSGRTGPACSTAQSPIANTFPFGTAGRGMRRCESTRSLPDRLS